MIFFFLSPAFHPSLSSEGKQLPAEEGTAGSWEAPGRVKTFGNPLGISGGRHTLDVRIDRKVFELRQGVLEFCSPSLCITARSTCSLSLDPAPSCPSPPASLKILPRPSAQSWDFFRREGQGFGAVWKWRGVWGWVSFGAG